MTTYPKAVIPRDFLERAQEFFQAYRDLPDRRPPSWPRYFMLCHSIELALKAYLLARGDTTAQLTKEFRHDLPKLLARAVEAGLPLGVLAYSEIEHLGEAHGRLWARYPKPTPRQTRGGSTASGWGRSAMLIGQKLGTKGSGARNAVITY
jgi:hypothetical protein